MVMCAKVAVQREMCLRSNRRVSFVYVAVHAAGGVRQIGRQRLARIDDAATHFVLCMLPPRFNHMCSILFVADDRSLFALAVCFNAFESAYWLNRAIAVFTVAQDCSVRVWDMRQSQRCCACHRLGIPALALSSEPSSQALLAVGESIKPVLVLPVDVLAASRRDTDRSYFAYFIPRMKERLDEGANFHPTFSPTALKVMKRLIIEAQFLPQGR